MRSITRFTSGAESIQTVSQEHRANYEWRNLELVTSDTIYPNAWHLNFIGQPQTDKEWQKLGLGKTA